MDVTSLYTNIPHDEGIKACEEKLDLRPELKPPTKDICNQINLILTKNNLTFNKQHYLQIQGTAMGTKMAPSYANIFMGKLEEEFLVTQSNQPAVWWRYIDDIFSIWTYGQEKLQQFINNLNVYHPSIKVKAEWSAAEVVFLDTTVRLKIQKIETDLYSKPTDKHLYLQRNSCHP